MSETNTAAGRINWTDLTVSNATVVRDFYREVVGWEMSDFDMGGYSDYVAHDQSGKVAAGICHARGINGDLPPSWLVYINVARLTESMQAVERLGGRILAGPRDLSDMGRFCVIQDPAGAIAALLEPPRP
jgi:predicted enzyme related to lactoylglutathione lyase